MTASERAAELRAQADALDALADLEEGLLAAKQAFAADPNPATKAAKQDAAVALREARARAREGRTGVVGGDAFLSNGSEA